MLANIALVFVIACVALAAAPAKDAAPVATVSAQGTVPFVAVSVKDRVQIPAVSALYRIKLEREVAATFGDVRPVARIAAQVHQESRWNAKAESLFAQGMTQFTPPTAEWIPSVCPTLGPPDVWDPNWSMRAAVCYDHWLYQRVDGASECDRWAFTLSAYNGGLGWVRRDKALTTKRGGDALQWFDHVALHSRRAGWAIRENRGYVQRILRHVEPVYLAAGWPGAPAC